MADISKELEQIKKARYGRDVRDSIYNAIDAINEEVIDYGTTASAAAAAAEASAEAAATSEANTKASSTASGLSAQAAATSESNAKASETAAGDSATVASDKADEAAVSASAALEYKKQAQSIIDNQASILAEINKKLELAEFGIDDDGNLTYTDTGGFIFTVNDNGYLEWEVVA